MVKLIDYYADWCGPCQAMKPVMHELEEEYKGKVTFEQVDVSDNMNRANAAGVLSIPTFMIEKDGKIVANFIGYQSKEAMKKRLDEILK